MKQSKDVVSYLANNMSIEIVRMIDDSVNSVSPHEGLTSEEAIGVWKNTLALYRLRFHQEYLIVISTILPTIVTHIEKLYPHLGSSISKVVNDVALSEIEQVELLSEVFPQLGISYLDPASEGERELIDMINDPTSNDEEIKNKIIEVIIKN